MNRNTLCSYNGTGGVFLIGSYEVRFGSRAVGTVTVHRHGLYYRFCCACRVSGDILCRLLVICGNVQQDLGILVPIGSGFGLETRIPVKRFEDGCPEFILIPNRTKVSALFVPVYPEEPFAYIAKLKNGFLSKNGNRSGICIKEPGR